MRPNINGIKVPFDKSTYELLTILDCELPLFYVACEALSYKGDDLSFVTLVSMLENTDPFKRRISVECLGNHAMFDSAVDHILICLDDKSPYVVRTAIETLVKHRVLKAHEKIIHLSKSKDELTREKAVSALEYIGNPSDFDFILSLYNDRNKRIRNLIPYIVLALANETTWEKAYNLMKHSNSEKARMCACNLLNAFGTKTEKDDAKLFLQDKSGHIRKYASKMIADNAVV